MDLKTFLFLSTLISFNMIVNADSNIQKNTDTEIIGDWITVDFIRAMELFKPEQLRFKGKPYLKGLSFETNSTVQAVYEDNQSSNMKWQSGKVHATPERPALYHIKMINNEKFLFYEWISGDVTIRGAKPCYYVLKKGEIKGGNKKNTSANRHREVQSVQTLDFYDDVRDKDLRSVQRLFKSSLLQSLKFNQNTIWPERSFGNTTIESFSEKLIHSAMNPGLGVRKLHKKGITGKGVNVAIIDQPMYQDHPEFNGKIIAYHDIDSGAESSMHGPAVASLLVGENCGTAPDAKVFYAAAPSWKRDAEYYAKALEWIIDQNRKLPAGQKIRVVSVSAAPSGQGSPFDKNNDMWDQACRKAEAEGLLVLDCTQHRGFIKPAYLKAVAAENPGFCNPGSPDSPWRRSFNDQSIFVPTCPRTSAEEYEKGKCTYIYWGKGGLSWAIPYAAGVLAMGWQIWPEATPDQLKNILFQSAYTNKNGAKIINPPRFINSVKKAKMRGGKQPIALTVRMQNKDK
ncbi:MAG: S8 family peptidase [Planctomycetota bacterium]|jgi:subtilisin family serine protease